MKKRTIAILLAFFMIFSFIPDSAFSQDKCLTPAGYLRELEEFVKNAQPNEKSINVFNKYINEVLVHAESFNKENKPLFSIQQRFDFQTKAIEIFFQFYFKDPSLFNEELFIMAYLTDFFGENYQKWIDYLFELDKAVKTKQIKEAETIIKQILEQLDELKSPFGRKIVIDLVYSELEKLSPDYLTSYLLTFAEMKKSLELRSRNENFKSTPESFFESQKEQLEVGSKILEQNIDEEVRQGVVYAMMFVVKNIFSQEYFQDKKSDFEQVKSVIEYLPFIGKAELNELQQKYEINIEDIDPYYEYYEEQLGTLFLDEEEMSELDDLEITAEEFEMIAEAPVIEQEESIFNDMDLLYFDTLIDMRTPFDEKTIDTQKSDFEDYKNLFDNMQLEFNFREIKDKIKKYNIMLENADLTEAQEKELRNLVRAEFLLGKYLSLTKQETDNEYFNELKNQYTLFQNSLKNFNSQINFFKEEDKNGNLINKKESEILDKMIDLEIKKRVQARDLRKKGIDLVYRPFMDFFNGDAIREIEIEGKPMVMLFDFEDHGIAAMLHQLVVEDILSNLEKNLITTGMTDKEILDIYTSQLTKAVKENGKIIKIPGTIFYGDNIVVSGDTAAYLKGDAEHPVKFYLPRATVFGVSFVPGQEIHYPIRSIAGVEFAATDGLIESKTDGFDISIANALLETDITKRLLLPELEILAKTKDKPEDDDKKAYHFKGNTWEIESEEDFNKFKPSAQEQVFVIKDDITLIKVDDTFKEYLQGIEAVPVSAEPVIFDFNPDFMDTHIGTFDSMELSIDENKISGLASEVNKLMFELRESTSEQDIEQIERLTGNVLAMMKQMQEEVTRTDFEERLEQDRIEDTLKKLDNNLRDDSKLSIINAVQEYNKNTFNPVNVDIIRQFLEVQNVDELIARLKTMSIC